MELVDLQGLNLDTIQDLLCIVAAGHPMSEIGEDLQSLSQAFEARGIYHLLLDFDVPAFTMNLQRSAHARRYFLRKSAEQDSDDDLFVALSRTDALFDCIAGGDWSLAPEIYRLSPPEWTPRGEYQEDYYYHGLIHAHVVSVIGNGDPELPKIWRDRLEAVVSAIPQSDLDVARLELCTAFLSGEEPAFWLAFEKLVGITGDIAAAVPLADGRVFEFPWLAADRHVSIELLAWIALARRRGFRPAQREYGRCPSAGWIDGHVAPAADLFLQIEGQFGL
jgi:hypothetical protein